MPLVISVMNYLLRKTVALCPCDQVLLQNFHCAKLLTLSRSLIQYELYYELILNVNAEPTSLNTFICLPLRKLNSCQNGSDMFKLTFIFNELGSLMKSELLLEVYQYLLKSAVTNHKKHPWKKVLLVLQLQASHRLWWLCCINLESFADSLTVTCF